MAESDARQRALWELQRETVSSVAEGDRTPIDLVRCEQPSALDFGVT